MKQMTLGYLIQDGRWLMLYRNRKQNDINHNKWIGVGGKIESGETPRQGMLREIQEETALICDDLKYRGILYFIYENEEEDKIWVYTSEAFHGTLQDCREGELKWIPSDEVLQLPLWEGDIPFLKKLLQKDPEIFCFHLLYDADGKLINAEEKEAEPE